MQKIRRSFSIFYATILPGGRGSTAGNAPGCSGSAHSGRSRAALWLFLFGTLCAGPAAAQQSSPDDLSRQSMEDLVKIKVDSVYGAAKFLEKAEDEASS